MTNHSCSLPPRSGSRNSLRSRLAVALVATGLLGATLFNAGCIALVAAGGAGAAVAYMRGDLDTTLDADFADSCRAAEKTLAELKYSLISNRQDALQGTLVARTAGDKKIELFLEKVTDDATKLKIRVGTFGEEALQNEILVRLRSHL